MNVRRLFFISSLTIAITYNDLLGASDILPNSIDNMNGVVIGNATPQPVEGERDNFTVNVRLSCFGQNLRKVPNPMRSGIPVFAKVTIGGVTETIPMAPPSAGSERVYTFEFTSQQTHSISAAGKISTTESGNLLRLSNRQVSASFYQNVATPCPYRGWQQFQCYTYRQVGRNVILEPNPAYTGTSPQALFGNVKQRRSGNGKVVDILASFAGEDGYCGGFYSPLMVFFDQKRPQFTGSSFFPLNPNSLQANYWPEANSSGYFLVMDRDQDGKITHANELFGNNLDPQAHGFKELARLDSNKDGIVDFKDIDWNKLQLWQDKNGDGISQKNELFSLSSKKIEFLSLRYDENHYISYGSRAEGRQRSVFVFRDDSGRQKSGEIVDIWLSPNGTTLQQVADLQQ